MKAYITSEMNQKRANWARKAVEKFASETGLDIMTDGLETAIGDLLGDIRHLCEQEKVDFNLCNARSQDYFHEESYGKD